MPEDRFGDLGAPDSAPGQSAAERLAADDERRSGDRVEEPGSKPPQASYLWVVGVVGLMVAIVVFATQFRKAPGGGGAVRGPSAGERLPAWAAPSATGDLDGDANVKQRAGHADSAGARPACDVRGAGIVNVCELRRRPLVLTFIVTRGTGCAAQLDRVQSVARRVPQVAFVAVVGGNDRDRVRELVRSKRLTFPVAVDRDGAVLNLNGVGVCPTTTFASAGGRVRETRLGALSEPELAAASRRLAPDAR